ncbi:hypothetical protein QAD02_008741 [Eretmocerus hayati]|uniref:Uncharacterized protein n=1 Tax=Eretmocerus hayati TaxID=131215 RepID=A0ACC2N7P8_9HYME|nr:hypothetical protein QAD02_008741 [Eretmocerus hayati]
MKRKTSDSVKADDGVEKKNSNAPNKKVRSQVSPQKTNKGKAPKYEKPTFKTKDKTTKSKDGHASPNKDGKPFNKKDFNKKTSSKGQIDNANRDQASTKKNGKPFKKKNMDDKSSAKNQSEQSPEGKPDWGEYKKKQKELREKRRAKKLDETYDVSIKAKQIGEKLRRSKLSPEMQQKLTKQLHELSQKQYAKMIYTHDLSRVIQWQIKYCSSDIQLAIVEELKPIISEMFFSKYAKNVIRTLLKKGSDCVKQVILEACFGKVVRLLSSVVSAPLFEKIYVEHASKAQKSALKQEMYGEMYKNYKDSNVKTLNDVYKDTGAMKLATLSTVKANLIKILNKKLINSTLVHTVLFEYLKNCSKEDRAEIIVMARPLIAELSQTRDGAEVGNICIWYGTSKDRKLIMKSLKEHIKDIVTSEHGHLMILALLDSVDDTVLLNKILLQEMLNNLSDIVLNEYGRRVVLYLVARRDTHYFHPALVEYLKQGDGNETSKKPADVREKELLDHVIDNLLASIAADSKTWLSNGQIQIVTLAILKASPGEKCEPAFKAISQFISDPETKLQKDDKTFKAIEEPGLHMILKKLIQIDKTRLETSELTFGEILIQNLDIEVIQQWVEYNRGCFLLITLLENESDQVTSELKSRIQKVEKLGSLKSKGAAILLKKLE